MNGYDAAISLRSRNMGLTRYSFLILLVTTHFLCAQQPLASTPSLRTDPHFACSVEPLRIAIPELWSPYPGELRVKLIIRNNGEVTDVTTVESTYSPDQTEAALKVLRTWEFLPATKRQGGGCEDKCSPAVL
jgi:TonB family protein